MTGEMATLNRAEEITNTDYPEKRECSRCDGTQFLIAYHNEFGKYRCDHCCMVVGFDVSAEKAEFIISKGMASHYTKETYGNFLNSKERRL